MADEAHVAVAANFASSHYKLAKQFESQTHYHIITSAASSGKLFAQIKHGAPYDIFLSADQKYPMLLGDSGNASANSRFTYAIGRLVLWSKNPKYIVDGEKFLSTLSYNYLAVANPRVAPYGAAAKQALRHMKLWGNLQQKLVRGESVLQAFQFIATGNAELGFIALSLLLNTNQDVSQAYWEVPLDYYTSLRQDAILLSHGKNNKVALAYLNFLKQAYARNMISKAGYFTE